MHLDILFLGIAEELGFSEAHGTRNAQAKMLIHEVTDPAYNPWLTGAYQFPTNIQDGNCSGQTPFFASWSAALTAWPASSQANEKNVNWPGRANDSDFGYPNIARAAASYTTDLADGTLTGQDTWKWLYSNANITSALAIDPRWALLPRNSTIASAGRSSNLFDLNSDGQLYQADIDLATKQALGSLACTNADLNNDGKCNIVDVQIVSQSVLKQSCTVR